MALKSLAFSSLTLFQASDRHADLFGWRRRLRLQNVVWCHGSSVVCRVPGFCGGATHVSACWLRIVTAIWQSKSLHFPRSANHARRISKTAAKKAKSLCTCIPSLWTQKQKDLDIPDICLDICLDIPKIWFDIPKRFIGCLRNEFSCFSWISDSEGWCARR